jgi:hypothetical protein
MNLNLKDMMPKVAGMAAGTLGAGAVLGALDKGTLSPNVKALILIGAGVAGAAFFGKNKMLVHAADAVMVKGIDGVLKNSPLGSYIRGVDDNVYGVDDNVYGTSMEDLPGGVSGVVSGPDGYDQSVSSNTI